MGVWHFQGIESCWCCGSQHKVLLSKTIWSSTLGRLRLEETLLGVTTEWILGSERRPSETIHMGHLTSNLCAIYVPFSHNKWRSRKWLYMQIIANACGGWGLAIPEIAHCLSSQCFQDSSKILLRLFSMVLPRYLQIPQFAVLWLANCLGLGGVCPEWTRGLSWTTMPSSYWWHVVTWCYVQICSGDVWGTGDFQGLVISKYV